MNSSAPTPPASPARLKIVTDDKPKYEHRWRETKTVALGRHIKQICLDCGIETFEDVRRISMRLPCVKRELAPDQIAALDEIDKNVEEESDSARRWVFLALYLAMFFVALLGLYRVASGAW